MVHGVEVLYSRFPVLPKVGALQGAMLSVALFPVLRRLHAEKSIDLINAHWFFPDGVAASWVAKRLGIPVVLSAHGCDVNLYTRLALRRPQILAALRRSAQVTVVSQPMRDRLGELGVPDADVQVILNGVDPTRFTLRDKTVARQALGLPATGQLILLVGQMVEVKGIPWLLHALRSMGNGAGSPTLLLVGEGPLRRAYQRLAMDLGLQGQVRFLGPRPNEDIPQFMRAADVLCLPSRREGCPTVVLESLACGLPVVASAVGAVPALVTDRNGVLFPVGDVPALASSLERALAMDWDPEAIRGSVAHITWDRVAEAYFQTYLAAIGAKGSVPGGDGLCAESVA
jgi:glycosyltransferase involved in cell wall biosynthesis